MDRSRWSAPISDPARAALNTASAVSAAQSRSVMIPEALLLTLLYEPSIHDGDGPVPEDEELRMALLASTESGNEYGWSSRAWGAYQRAWARARERARRRPLRERARDAFDVVSAPGRFVPLVLVQGAKLSVGDLFSGLAGSGALVDATLRRRAIDPASLDEEILPEIGYASGLPDDAPVDVIALDDDATPMPFVVAAFEEHFRCAQIGALHRMYRVDACGRARLCRCSRIEAERRIAAAHDAARAEGYPLAFIYGPRARATEGRDRHRA